MTTNNQVSPVALTGTTTMNEWSRYVEGLVPLGDRFACQLTDAKDIQLRQEMYRMMFMSLAQGYFELVYQDSEYPDFWPAFNQAFNIVITNPDDSYHMTPLKANGVYRINGFRGTVRTVDFQIASGEFFYTGLGEFGPTLRNFDLDEDVHVRDDNSFEVILSAERPTGYEGDWWQLDPRATHLLVRQISYDWIEDVDGRFAIERLDLPAIKPRASADKMASQLSKIPQFLENWTQWTLDFTASLYAKDLVNKLQAVEFTGVGGVASQTYLNGLFELEQDEALIVELGVPEGTRYWSITLYDELLIVPDWQNRQTHLNGLTARADADGNYRFVISEQDPGVPNWLDSAGYHRGVMFSRLNGLTGEVQSDFKRVKLADLRKHLPAETPTVTLEQRDQKIRKYRSALQLRHRW